MSMSMSMSMSMRTRALRYGVAGAILATIAVGVAAEAEADQLLEWTRHLGTEGSDFALGVATDAAGNVYVTGETWGSLGGGNHGLADAWIAKYDAAGIPLWKRQLGTATVDSASGVATDAAGNVYLTGLTVGSFAGPRRGETDAWIVKYDAAGTRLWTRQLGTEESDDATGVATDAAGNVYLTGRTGGALGGGNRGGYDAWVAKYDAAGTPQWKRQLGTAYNDAATGVATDAAGDVYLTGYTEGSLGGANSGRSDAWIAKYDAAGTRQWKRQLGTEGDDDAYGVATDAAGDVYMTGWTSGSLGGPNGGLWDAWIAKFDAAGTPQWKRQLGNESEDAALGVATDAAGNVYLTGWTSGSLNGPSRGGFDAWIAKYDASGTRQWKRQFGTKDIDTAHGVATDAAGNVYMTGNSQGSLGGANLGSTDAWVAKLAPND